MPSYPIVSLPVVFSKLQNVKPADIVVMADYDLTLARKSREAFDHAPLTRAQHEGLRLLSSNIGRFSVVTARGEKSVMDYLFEYGPLPNTMLATNSGHIVRTSLSPLSDPWTVYIPGYSGSTIRATVGAIHGIVRKMKDKFPDILANERELCGAVVFQFEGGRDSDLHKSFQEQADKERRALSPELAAHILFSAKSVETHDFDGRLQTQGYIDIKPVGMDKGLVVSELFKREARAVTDHPFVIVAGDSAPDYEMMKALAPLVPEDRRLFVSVGRGLEESDRVNGKPLLDVVLPGEQEVSVQSLHDLFAIVGRTPFRKKLSPASVFRPVNLAA